MNTYPAPAGGASLLLAFRPTALHVLIVGAQSLAASRAFSALEADANIIIAASHPIEQACNEVQWRVRQGQIRWEAVPDGDFARLIDSLSDLSLVFITDTLIGSPHARSYDSASSLFYSCRSRRIPVNTADMPTLCNFTIPSTHRFPTNAKNSTPSSLQIAITTNGRGCRLAGRIRRDLIAKLHPDCGDAVHNIGRLRDMAKELAYAPSTISSAPIEEEGDREDGASSLPLNRPVPQIEAVQIEEDPQERTLRRMRWVNQVSEYWPIEKLAMLDDASMREILQSMLSESSPAVNEHDRGALESDTSRHNFHPSSASSSAPSNLGQIFLVGSGPGHPSMLTQAAHKALTKLATLVLSDKLVPAEILALIPPHIPVYVAKKFPGNAEGAQNELMSMAVEAARKGETVVRLKQGDPMLYGRGGEEVLHFRQQGFPLSSIIVIPGLSSSLAAPTFLGIPVTQRGVSESLTICTGVGRRGKEITLPGYERERTLVILMGVARLAGVVDALMDVMEVPESDACDAKFPSRQRKNGPGKPYPPYLPIAIIERASSPDQRIVASTLSNICSAMERVGEQRPPGLIVVGWSVLALEGVRGDLDVLDDAIKVEADYPGDREHRLEEIDRKRVDRWLTEAGAAGGYVMRDGLGREWEQFL